MYETIRNDLKLALRGFAREPWFSAVAILSLGLGIGAATIVFSVLEMVNFRPLPYAHSDRLVVAQERSIAGARCPPQCEMGVSFATAAEWRTGSPAFEALELYYHWTFNWQRGDAVNRLQAAQVTPGFFSMLGIRPQYGRDFIPGDTDAGAPKVAIISYEFWRTQLGSDPKVIGTHLTRLAAGDADPQDYAIIGILPRTARFWDPIVVWSVVPPPRDASAQNERLFSAIGRLHPRETLESSLGMIAVLETRLRATSPQLYGNWTASVEPLRSMFLGPSKSAQIALVLVVASVVLIATFNVTGLTLVRMAVRQREFAVSRALGASRVRLVGRILVECVLLSVCGGLIALLTADWGARATAVGILGPYFGLSTTFDLHVVEFAGVTAVLVGIVVALLTVAPLVRTDLERSLGSRTNPNQLPAHRRTMRLLVIAQIGASLVLLAAAGSAVRQFLHLSYVEPGFDPRDLYAVPMLQDGREGKAASLATMLMARGGDTPGVVASAVQVDPVVNSDSVLFESATGNQLRAGSGFSVTAVSTGYFGALGIPMRQGRPFSPADRMGNLLVGIVNAAAANDFWPGEQAVGRQVLIRGTSGIGESVTIVGVSASARPFEGVEGQPSQVLYLPLDQASLGPTSFLVLYTRIRGDQRVVLPALLGSIADVTHHPNLTPQSAASAIHDELRNRLFNTMTLTLFALFTMLLSAMGVAGVIAYSVARRRQEIGIRLALGAGPRDVVLLLVREGIGLAVPGILVGVIAWVVLANNSVSSFHPMSSDLSVVVFGFAATLTILVVVAATVVPARIAAAVDPTLSLRHE